MTDRNYLSLALWHLGYPDQALKMDREARELARTIGHAYSLGHAVDFTAFLSCYCRLGNEVQAAADEELTLGGGAGLSALACVGNAPQGGGAAPERGGERKCCRSLLRGLMTSGPPERKSALRRTLVCWATRTPNVGAVSKSSTKHSTRGYPLQRRTTTVCHEAELYRLKGELLLAESPDQAALPLRMTSAKPSTWPVASRAGPGHCGPR